jgi:uncharacterized paraquat-inducible protein A
MSTFYRDHPMRKLNNITAALLFTMAFAGTIAFISGAHHHGFTVAITVLLGFAHLADNKHPSKS